MGTKKHSCQVLPNAYHYILSPIWIFKAYILTNFIWNYSCELLINSPPKKPLQKNGISELGKHKNIFIQIQNKENQNYKLE